MLPEIEMMIMRFNFGKTCAALILLAGVSCGMPVPVYSQISVIVAKHARLDSAGVKQSSLKEIYTGAKLKWPGGHKIQVVDQAGTEVGKKFYEKVLGKSLHEMRRQWAQLTLSGQAAPPAQCSSDKTVKKIVAANPHAIGYIATAQLDDSVKEILRVQ